jgi:hypothetical protein
MTGHTEQEHYLILCYDHSTDTVAFWRTPERRGYTDDLEDAGTYSKEEAEPMVREANLSGAINEIAVPVSALRLLATRMILNSIGCDKSARKVLHFYHGSNRRILKSFEQPA